MLTCIASNCLLIRTRIKILFTVLMLPVFQVSGAGQSVAPQPDRLWAFQAELNTYFFSDGMLLMPIAKADYKRLHLETRYNYEDDNTFSAWAGYNFSGGDILTYTFTPMAGLAVGQTNGVAPGLEILLEFKKFELYSEWEYLFDLSKEANHFWYTYTDVSYTPKDWLWFGLSGQRTRQVDSGLVLEHGVFIGTGWKNWELTGYWYNPFTGDTFGFVTLGVAF